MMAVSGAWFVDPSWLVWSLVVYGVVLIVTGSKICEPLRRRAEKASKDLGFLLSCPMCFGCWVGFFLAARGFPVVSHVGAGYLGILETLVLNGALGSAVSWTMHVVLAKLGAEEL